MKLNLNNSTDKVFWHNFIQFYEKFLIDREINSIAEIGIFKGNSIRWLLERFPKATIDGADILPLQPEWPVDDRFTAHQFDQSNVEELTNFFNKKFDLIIEDGSHIPIHQILALNVGFKSLNSNGIYILEDIHTSHQAIHRGGRGNALSVLLGIDHYNRIGIEVNEDIAEKIATGSHFTTEEVVELASNIAEIHLYKRTNFPNFCYNCGSSDFNFSEYKCVCGTDIFSDTDSMTFIIIKK